MINLSRECHQILYLIYRNNGGTHFHWYNVNNCFPIKYSQRQYNCLICRKVICIIEGYSSSEIDKSSLAIKQHGLQHLKEKNLLAFI